MFRFRSYLIIVLVTFSLLRIPSVSDARFNGIDGSVALGYHDYDIDNSTAGNGSANSFYQRYNLNSGFSGNLYNEKSGLYHINLNYNHDDYSNKINGEKYSLNSDTLDLDGELRLLLYHLNGLQMKFFSDNYEYNQARTYTFSGGRLGYGFATELKKLQNKISGFTGSMGQNGGTLYYFSYITEERETIDGYKNRQRGGHFSIENGTNCLTISQTETRPGDWRFFSVHIGNVSYAHRTLDYSRAPQRRYWYRLSNWVKISTDYRYTKTDEQNSSVETDRLTLALTGERNNWDISTYTTYGKSRSDNLSSYDLSVPLWISTSSASLGRYFTLNSSYSERMTKNNLTFEENKIRTLREQLSLWTKPREDMFMESRYSFATSRTDDVKETGHNLYVRGYSSQKKKYNYRFAYNFDSNQRDANNNDESSSYSHRVDGYLSYNISPGKTFGINQGIGMDNVQDRKLGSSTESAEKSWVFATTLFFNSSFGQRSHLSVTMGRNLLSYEDGSKNVNESFEMGFNRSINSKTSFKAAIDYEKNDSDLPLPFGKTTTEEYRNTAKLVYKGSKAITSTTSLLQDKDLQGSFLHERTALAEELKYTFYKRDYGMRPVLNTALSLSVDHDKWGDDTREYRAYSISVNYFPQRKVQCGANYSKRYDTDNIYSEENSGIYFGVSFPLLSLSTSYMHRDIDDLFPVVEDRYRIDLTKKF